MSVTNFLALRYLKSSQENRFFSWITILSAIGIAIGVAALIVVLSVINGFESELRKRFLHANAHIMAYRFPDGMAESEQWRALIMNEFGDDVQGVSAFIHQETMAKSGPIMQGVLVRGFNPKQREVVQSLEGLLEPSTGIDALQAEIDGASAGAINPEIPSIIIGIGLKSILNTDVGQEIYLVSPDKKGSSLRPFKIAGFYNSGLKHYDNRLIIMSLPTAQELFHLGSAVTGVEIGLFDLSRSAEVEQAMQAKYSQLTFREWQSFNRPLFETLQKERLLIAVIVAIVVLVAGFNILTTVFVSVSQKQKDISILKALGATNKQIVKVFVSQGAYIGVIGGVLGGLLAAAISWILEHEVSRILELPDPYFLRKLPVNYSVTVYITVVSAAIIMCIVASIYPAKIAAKIEPSAGFRGNEGVI